MHAKVSQTVKSCSIHVSDLRLVLDCMALFGKSALTFDLCVTLLGKWLDTHHSSLPSRESCRGPGSCKNAGSDSRIWENRSVVILSCMVVYTFVAYRFCGFLLSFSVAVTETTHARTTITE